MLEAKIPVVETFGPTIQGEGSMAGTLTWFIRTGGCDYKCKYCDSMHAVEATEVNKGPWLTPTQLVNRLATEMYKYAAVKWVTLSGGNPCMWKELGGVLSHLRQVNGLSIALETQGTIVPPWLQHCDAITISPKTPGMGEKLDFAALDKFILAAKNETKCLALKVVIFRGADNSYRVDLNCAEQIRARYPDIPFYLSQGNTEINTAQPQVDLIGAFPALLGEVFTRRLLRDVKVLPQLHVWLWGNKRAV